MKDEIMKILLVYYSRTGTTGKVAKAIRDKVDCDLEELIDTVKRNGVFGYIRCGFQAVKKKHTVLKPLKHDPSKYDLVLVGTPVWAGGMSTPIRTFLHEHKGQLEKVAFFRTCGNIKYNPFDEMEVLCGKKPLGAMGIMEKAVKKGDYSTELKKFVENINL